MTRVLSKTAPIGPARLELFDTLMSSLAPRGERKRNKERLRTLRDLDAAALVLRDVGRLVLNEQLSSGRIRKEAFKNIGQDTILAANTTVTELVQEDTSEETENWLEAVHVVSRFLPTLLSTLKFEGTPGMKPLLEAIAFLQKPHRTKSVWRQAPRDFIPKSWESRVLPLGRDPDRGAYSVCVAYLLHAALKRRDLFVERSHRFGDPRIQLLQGVSWEALRGDVCRTLNLSPIASEAIQTLTVQLEAAYRRTLEGLPDNAWVRFESQDGRNIPIVQALEPQENTVRLEAMSDRAYSFIPDVDLSELLLEIHAQTGFADEFSLASEGEGRVSDFAKSLCAVLVAQACNIGLKAVSRPGIPALSLGRLSWVQQNYLRADTLIRANARLVEAHTDLPLARKWGDGEVASADGLRFVVPVRTVYSRPNSKYFGAGRGITYYTFTSDQFSAFHGLVIPGTLRDSLYILSWLLEQQTVLQPKELMSDTAGYSDVVFGLFHLLGYQFSPRLADLEHVRYWRIDRSQDYGLLEDVARNRINTALISEHWDDVLRLVGSLKLGTVKAPDILRTLAREGSLSGLGKAVAEVGRISKTLYLLEYLHDEGYRRRIQIQLNRTELRHRLARAIYHGQRGEMRQKYREGMEDQLGALGLVVNAVVLWNTRYLGASLEWLEAISDEVHPDDVPRLSPLRFAHINMLGRYHFEVNADVAAGMLRPLRDPDSTDAFETAWNER